MLFVIKQQIYKFNIVIVIMEELLEEIGLTTKESKAYLALLKLGTATVQELSKIAHINRSYSYNILTSLASKGLVTYTIKSGKQYFETTPPIKLLDLLKEKQKKVEQALPQLELLHKSIVKKPSIEIYEQKEGVKTLMQKVIDNAKTEYVGIGNQKHFEKYFAFYNQAHINRRIEKKVKAKYIFEESKEARVLEKLNTKEMRETKHFKELNDVHADIWSFGDKLILLTYVENQPIGIEIENKELSKLFQTIFEMLWKVKAE